MRSHPVWVRGLKRLLLCLTPYTEESHPVWVRGLKLIVHRRLVYFHDLVAPRVGAWIETRSVEGVSKQEKSHPVWVRGLKRGSWFAYT